ncbi:hypothetical protein HAX54_043201 [Datura stramonium]|uniref:Uncharacterized protein n=1 Tax=Datura stramonium TaxID=4076 RepID=A0ABS8W488_DATST|nr:hypothetical protein [Datura stramonium]
MVHKNPSRYSTPQSPERLQIYSYKMIAESLMNLVVVFHFGHLVGVFSRVASLVHWSEHIGAKGSAGVGEEKRREKRGIWQFRPESFIETNDGAAVREEEMERRGSMRQFSPGVVEEGGKGNTRGEEKGGPALDRQERGDGSPERKIGPCAADLDRWDLIKTFGSGYGYDDGSWTWDAQIGFK